MKRRWIINIVVILILLSLFWWMNGAVSPAAVERMELTTTDHTKSKTIVLSDTEKWIALSLHNLGLWVGDISGEPGEPDFAFDVYLKNGKDVDLNQAQKGCVNIYGSPLPKIRRCCWNPLFIGYMRLLVWVYDMPIDATW